MHRNVYYVVMLFFLLVPVAKGQIKFRHLIDTDYIESRGFQLQMNGDRAKLCSPRYGVITLSGGKLVVDIWDMDNKKACPNGTDTKGAYKGLDFNTAATAVLTLTDNRKTLKNPVKMMRIPFQQWTVAINALPFRYRMPVTVNGNRIAGAVASGFTIAPNIGRTWGKSHISPRAINNHSNTVSFFAGPGVAELKKNTVINPDEWGVDQSNATIVYGLSYTRARNALGFVIGVGLEHALGRNSSKWIYNNQPFLGIGINTGFGR